MIKTEIDKMIEQIVDTCLPWVKPEQDGLLRFIDPIDHVEISAHYGATHAAVAFIINGERRGNKEITETGYKLLASILKRWGESKKLPGYHNDFNNFALCALVDYLEKKHNGMTVKYIKAIKQTVLRTSDSNNPTVNWLPMRWYVNLMRYKWTGRKEYELICKKCREDIEAATYSDGFIDDRIPKGISFNLQYDVATVALLEFLRSKGERIDISAELSALITATAPDGDINYLGRGTNQIFAWGMWIYLLAASANEYELDIAVNYLNKRLTSALSNNNIMLNDWKGSEKYLWWDYHYCSVYTAHLLFWLELACDHFNKFPVNKKNEMSNTSGLSIVKNDNYFIAIFEGRKEYLPERGPAIAALWTKTNGMIFKGYFGPWQSHFGSRYSESDVVLRNYIGLISVKENRDLASCRYLRKISEYIQLEASETITPLFIKPIIKPNDGKMELIWDIKNIDSPIILNVPVFNPLVNMQAFADGKRILMNETLKVRNQYTWISVYQSKAMKTKQWKLQFDI